MSAPALSPEILRALTAGATLLTASQRPARALRLAFDQHQQARGETLWAPPAIFALDTWLASLYNQLLVLGEEQSLLLNRTQELALWRNIISSHRDNSGHRSPDALAALALEAWSTLCLHGGRQRIETLAAAGPDARAFQRWARTFQRLCTAHGYLTPPQLPSTLESALSRGSLPLPNPGLSLVDFDLLRPAHQQLFDSILRAGYPVQHISTSLPSGSASLHPAPDQPSELRAAVCWARDLIQQDPATRVAIVVPSLASLRPGLERICAELLAPASNPITSSVPPTYEFSLGTPLAHTALASTALDLLRWTLQPLSLDRISTLLLSPHFGSPSDAAAIAAFDASELRGHTILRPELTLATVVQHAAGYNHRRALGSLTARLQALERAAAELSAPPARRSYSHWVEAFSSLLTSVGWAATARTDSLHFQLHRRWQSALDEFATLDFDGVTVSASTAIDTLARLLRSAIFAPESRNAPVQIIGPLELGGVPFDALWFLSAEDSTWPVRIPSNPLIPRFLERELHLPGADLTADHLAAALLTRRIARSAPQVVFSYGIESESGSHRPSPLLRELELASLTHSPSTAPVPALPAEEFLDDQPIPPPAPAILKGGAVVLELQAACPFRAFAERRLFSAEPETREPGLDPRERGTVVHEVMQLFWSEVQSQRALKALTTSARDALLDSCIEAALHKPTRTAAGPWDTAYVQVERRRLSALLPPWLEEELRRPPFVVSASERKLSDVQIGPLHLDLRVDRIDQIGDPDESDAGTLDLPTAIIDYKTGSAATGQWLSERPEKPQLPLYAVAASPPPAGVAFAVLKAGKDRGLESFAVDRQIFGSSRNKDFETQLEDWNRVLTNLAEAFHQGDVTVDPRAYPKTCEHCSQRTLCRLDLSLVDDLAEEDDRLAESEVSAE